MRRVMFGLVAAAIAILSVSPAIAQDPYLPVSPNGKLMVPDSTAVPGTTIPTPSGTFGAPDSSIVTTTPTVVAPGSVPPGSYWTGYRGWGLFGGYNGAWQTNYQYGAPMGGGCGTCNQCPNPCAPPNYEFNYGYDGFMTGWW